MELARESESEIAEAALKIEAGKAAHQLRAENGQNFSLKWTPTGQLLVDEKLRQHPRIE